jgi:predicted anti-sigma-YlaC factor YlaD
MKHRSVIGKFLEWTGHELGAEERAGLERHLEGCEQCREYYRKMTLLLRRPDPAHLPRLTPDPVAPRPGRAAARDAVARSPGWAIGWARVSIAGATLALALAGGIYLGSGLSRITESTEESYLAEAYYEAFSPADFAGGWETLINTASAPDGEETDR